MLKNPHSNYTQFSYNKGEDLQAEFEAVAEQEVTLKEDDTS